jgi:hypothetical protein
MVAQATLLIGDAAHATSPHALRLARLMQAGEEISVTFEKLKTSDGHAPDAWSRLPGGTATINANSAPPGPGSATAC